MNLRLPVLDAHVDLLYALMRDAPGRPFHSLAHGRVTPSGLSMGGVRIFVSAFYCPDRVNGEGTALPYLRSLLDYWRAQVSLPGPLRASGEVEAAWVADGPSHALFLLENGDCLMDMGLSELYDLGFRLVGLTHFGRNRIADGNGVRSPEGLTAAGRRIVLELDRFGMIIDTAHLSEPAFREVAALTSNPLVTTHTGLRAFCDTPRNLSPAQVGVIARRGGVVGLALAPDMLATGGRITVEEVFLQIDWLVQRFGSSIAGLGSDFGGFRGGVEGLADHAGLGRLAERMDRAGYTLDDIAAVMGGNWYRFFRKTLPP
jgi:membrane dipeptidase